MGKELSLARTEEEGQSVLLAITSTGKSITASSHRNQRPKEPSAVTSRQRREAKNTSPARKRRTDTEGANAGHTRPKRRRQDNKDRKQNRGEEGENKPVGRSAQKLGITYPGSYCGEDESVPHYWVGIDKIDKGSLFQCRLCKDYLWLPEYGDLPNELKQLMRKLGDTEGYCQFLNSHRRAKVRLAKLQDLRKMEVGMTDMREFGKAVERILKEKEYDR